MRIIKSELIARTQWLNLFQIAYRDQRDEQRSWQLASRREQPKCISGEVQNPDAVIIVPYHIERCRLVITREYRVPLGDVEYGFPAGLIDPGESAEAAAERELWEETGLELTAVLEVGPPLFSSAGMTDESVAPVYVECRGAPSRKGLADGEQIEIEWLTPEDAGRLCRDRRKKFDAKAWLIMRSFAESGRICSRQNRA